MLPFVDENTEDKIEQIPSIPTWAAAISLLPAGTSLDQIVTLGDQPSVDKYKQVAVDARAEAVHERSTKRKVSCATQLAAVTSRIIGNMRLTEPCPLSA